MLWKRLWFKMLKFLVEISNDTWRPFRNQCHLTSLFLIVSFSFFLTFFLNLNNGGIWTESLPCFSRTETPCFSKPEIRRIKTANLTINVIIAIHWLLNNLSINNIHTSIEHSNYWRRYLGKSILLPNKWEY